MLCTLGAAWDRPCPIPLPTGSLTTRDLCADTYRTGGRPTRQALRQNVARASAWVQKPVAVVAGSQGGCPPGGIPDGWILGLACRLLQRDGRGQQCRQGQGAIL